MSEKVTIALTGALLGAAAAVLIQIFLVPRVQARIRKQDRWERDVDEVAVLVEDQLRSTYGAYRSIRTRLRATGVFLDDPTRDQDRVREFIAADEVAERQAYDRLSETMAHFNLLHRRLRRIRPKSPYWNYLFTRWAGFRVTLFDVEPDYYRAGPTPTDEAEVEAWSKVDASWKALVDAVKEIAEPEPRLPPARKRRAAPG